MIRHGWSQSTERNLRCLGIFNFPTFCLPILYDQFVHNSPSMLFGPSASSTGRQHSRNLLRIALRPSAGSQQLRSASWIAQGQADIAPKSPSLALSTCLSRRTAILKNASSQRLTGRRLVSSGASTSESETSAARDQTDDKDMEQLVALIDKHTQEGGDLTDLISQLNEKQVEMVKQYLETDEVDEIADDQLDATNDVDEELTPAEWVQSVRQSIRGDHTLDQWVQLSRQRFGESVPEGWLDVEELQHYTRLYGAPTIQSTALFDSQREGSEAAAEEDETATDRLFREDGRGGWEEVEFEQNADSQDDIPVVYDMEDGPAEKETIAMQRTREVAEQLGGEVMLEQFENEAVPGAAPRAHPLTAEAKFETDPSTVFLPKKTVTGPISIILSEFSNKHVTDTARRLFGGPGLPHSTTTPPPRAQMPQLPIPLHAAQHHMGEMEANAYIAALYPGIYASVLSVLVEVRKRLGASWIRRLFSQEGGPNVLDASGGGAGILAWRDVLRTEWELMVPDHPEGAPIPLGRSTVLTGSESLQLRASAMLEDTSFLPRLPDYIHVREKPTLDDSRPAPKRKQYDVIIAPHTLIGFEEEFERKEYVENLWELLNPNGGVLILLEKGRQKGFEAIAGAREMLLKRHIASPGSTEYTNFTDSPDDSETVPKEPGMIIAPCTNHSTCPMHNPAGPTKGRRDYCHFEQRYIRPPFLQRIIGSKDRNHEDVKFSYLAVQRGVDLRQEQGIRQDTEATDDAFAGYEHLDESDARPAFHTLSLPRSVYPPLKRRGHVIFDLCTPAGKIERWTVPRSFSRQAYRDARKSNWGDLWALGAKTRIPRKLNLGDKYGEGKKERLERRAAAKAAMREEGEEAAFDDEDLEDDEDGEFEDEDLTEPPVRKKGCGSNVPSWKKYNDKKKLRQAFKRQSAAEV